MCNLQIQSEMKSNEKPVIVMIWAINKKVNDRNLH